MAKDRSLHRKLVLIWQEITDSRGAYCPYPTWQKNAFEDLACILDHEIIEVAFRLWAKEPKSKTDAEFCAKYPIDAFTKRANAYTIRAEKLLAGAEK